MKLKYSIALAAAVLFAPDVEASIATDVPTFGNASACQLSGPQTANLDAAWTALARRLFLASMEVMEDPDQFIRVRAEVKKDLRTLRRTYGNNCVRPIG